ncbi:MAG: hypothetical protein AB1810_08480 [Pseudomonadota bacterium]
MKIRYTIPMLIAAGLWASSTVWAAEDTHHDHSSHDHGAHESLEAGHNPAGMAHGFLKEQEVDGYKVSFHVMGKTPGMDHGGSHNLMVKIEAKGKALQDVVINSKVVHPNGSAETKPLLRMGDWYMNGYDLAHDGKHQLMILFKTADGEKHKAGVYYPE